MCLLREDVRAGGSASTGRRPGNVAEDEGMVDAKVMVHDKGRCCCIDKHRKIKNNAKVTM
jgi:hypothetical protein